MRYLFFIVFVFLSISNANSARKHLEHINLELHWKYQFEYAGFIAAKEKGFYKDAGLDVALHEYEMGADVEAKVLNNKATYAIYNSSILVDYLRGKPIILVASFFKRSAAILITQSEIKTPKDLVGKTIMGSTKEDLALNFLPYFSAYHVSLDDFKLVKHTYSLDDFINKKVDAITAFRSDQPYKLDKLGVKYNILDPSNENLYALQEELFTSKEEAVKHPQRVVKFRDATIKGWQYAFAHKEELVDIIQKKYAKNLTKDALLKEADAIEKLILPYTYYIGSIDRSFLNKQADYFKKLYHIKSSRTLDNFIFTEDKNSVFTAEELAYIKMHRAIKVCINYDLFPLDGYQDGKMVGIMSDIFKLIANKTSLNFVPVNTNSTDDLRKKVEEKVCKLVSVVVSDKEDYRDIKPTQPFSSTFFTLVSSLEKPFIEDVKDIEDKTLIVQRKSFQQYLHSLYPRLHIEVEADKNIMVKKILKDQAYAIATIDEQADYLINKYGYGKLKINGFLAKEKPIKGSIGVLNEEKILYSIIDKVVGSIPYEEIKKIEDGWRIGRYKKDIDYAMTLKIMVIMFFVFIVMFYYQRKLKNFNRELEDIVHEKTRELRVINESLEATVQEKIQELIKKDEILTMQSKQAVMGEMLSMIAHQWRQPLNTITLQISNLQIQEMMGVKIEQKEMMRTLDEISKTIVYLSDTIDDFKTYFDPNKNATKIGIYELINKALKFINPRLKSRKIDLIINTQDDFEVSVFVNEFTQVLLNIINNAIDAYANIESDDKKIWIDVCKNDKKVQIAIKDNAGGIKQEIVNKIFDPYFSTKGKNGTGLGLYMSKMIIQKQFNGDIEVSSADGSTTFTIEIPLDVQEEI